MNNINIYLIIFGVGVFVGICLYFKIINVCRKLGLNPPMPTVQSEQIKFFKFVNEKSKIKGNESLRFWVIIQKIIIYFLILMLIIIFIEAS